MASCARTISGYPAIETSQQVPRPRVVKTNNNVCRNIPTLRASAGPRSRCMQTIPASGARKNAQLAAKVLERFGQGRDVRWPTLGRLEQGLDEAVARWAGREHDVPGLDVRVRRRLHGQGEGLIHQLPRHRLGQKQPCRMALPDYLLKIE